MKEFRGGKHKRNKKKHDQQAENLNFMSIEEKKVLLFFLLGNKFCRRIFEGEKKSIIENDISFALTRISFPNGLV
jgi:hypothetical protein